MGSALVSLAGAQTSQGRKVRPEIGLALGSGGATGLAHIPMLEVFDELGIKPGIIAGSSIGSIIGALYASGLSGKEIRRIVNEFSGLNMETLKVLVQGDWGLKLTDLLRLDLDAGGLVDSQGFLNFLKTKIRVSSFEELSIPLKVVAADYWKRKQVVLDKGDLLSAVKASMAVPGLFAPVALNDKLLVDGGTVNPLPYDILEQECDIVVAVDVSGDRTVEQSDPPDLSDSLFNAFEIMQQSIIFEKMKHRQPDIYIRPQVRDVRLLHFHRFGQIFEQAVPAADKLKKELKSYLE